jgi:hypothetical protein
VLKQRSGELLILTRGLAGYIADVGADKTEVCQTRIRKAVEFSNGGAVRAPVLVRFHHAHSVSPFREFTGLFFGLTDDSQVVESALNL